MLFLPTLTWKKGILIYPERAQATALQAINSTQEAERYKPFLF
jgi:hypothetical protein